MTGALLSDEQRLDWLRLIRTDRVGPRTFGALIDRFGGARAALEALPDLARRGGGGTPKVPSRADVEREMEATARLGARFVALGEPGYPTPLRAIDTAPPLIAVRGDAAVTARPAIAIVGSRNASSAGLTFTERLASDLGRADYVIVSGLARGIDARAHKAALSTGTIAVLAGGLDRVYPAENQPLLERFLQEGGAVITEMPLGWEPRGRDFPRRNRIVSGLSYGVVVVEAARRSGSLITARFALEQGREVFAVPGSPIDPRAEGTNDLIRNGATLCASAEHVLAAMAPLLEKGPQPAMQAREPEFSPAQTTLWDEWEMSDLLATTGPGATLPLFEDGTEIAADDASLSRRSDQERIVGLLGPAPVKVDDLARQAEVPVRLVQLVLTDLELAGRLERHGGNAVSLIPTPRR